ncbi:hypothetical protein WAI453_001943 [Rhynchosporium graminicola]
MVVVFSKLLAKSSPPKYCPPTLSIPHYCPLGNWPVLVCRYIKASLPFSLHLGGNVELSAGFAGLCERAGTTGWVSQGVLGVGACGGSGGWACCCSYFRAGVYGWKQGGGLCVTGLECQG